MLYCVWPQEADRNRVVELGLQGCRGVGLGKGITHVAPATWPLNHCWHLPRSCRVWIRVRGNQHWVRVALGGSDDAEKTQNLEVLYKVRECSRCRGYCEVWVSRVWNAGPSEGMYAVLRCKPCLWRCPWHMLETVPTMFLRQH